MFSPASPLLAVRIYPDSISVTVPRVLTHLSPTLGLFLNAALETMGTTGSAGLSCTAAAVAWRCLSSASTDTMVASFPQPELAGSYTFMLLTDDCNPIAASDAFSVGGSLDRKSVV